MVKRGEHVCASAAWHGQECSRAADIVDCVNAERSAADPSHPCLLGEGNNALVANNQQSSAAAERVVSRRSPADASSTDSEVGNCGKQALQDQTRRDE